MGNFHLNVLYVRGEKQLATLIIQKGVEVVHIQNGVRTSAGGEGQVYEQVGGGEGGVAVSDHTYMEVGAGGEEEGTSRRMKLMVYIQNNVVLDRVSEQLQVHAPMSTSAQTHQWA